MSDLKSFPASEQKLSNLRSDGIFPFSKLVFSSSAVLALSLSVLILPSVFSSKLSYFLKMAYSANASLDKLSSEGFSILSSIFLYLTVLFGGILALFGLLQSRFYFNLSLIKLDFSRFFSRIFSLRISISSIFSFFFLSIITVSVIIFSYSFLVEGHDELVLQVSKKAEVSDSSVSSDSYVVFLSNKRKLALSSFDNFFDNYRLVLLICVFFSIALGLSCYFINSILFKRQHMMTRVELESELKEQEVSYEFKEQMSERHNSLE